MSLSRVSCIFLLFLVAGKMKFYSTLRGVGLEEVGYRLSSRRSTPIGEEAGGVRLCRVEKGA